MSLAKVKHSSAMFPHYIRCLHAALWLTIMVFRLFINLIIFYMWSRHCISRSNCHISQFFALYPLPKSPNWSDNFLSMIFGILGEIGIEIVEHIFYIKIFFDRKCFSSKNKKYVFEKISEKISKFQNFHF